MTRAEMSSDPFGQAPGPAPAPRSPTAEEKKDTGQHCTVDIHTASGVEPTGALVPVDAADVGVLTSAPALERLLLRVAGMTPEPSLVAALGRCLDGRPHGARDFVRCLLLDGPQILLALTDLVRAAERENHGAATATFRHEGEYWTIGYDGIFVRLRASKGLAYLARLLAHPGEPFAATDLLDWAPGRGSTKPEAERARVLVTKALHHALGRLRRCHPTLGTHLTSRVRTGGMCTYRPDPTSTLRWEITNRKESP